jgi:hypothetical protein
MRLAGAGAAQANGGVLSQEEYEQLQYVETLTDVSHNCNSHCCQVIGRIDEDIFKIPFPAMIYFTQNNHLAAVEWLYPGGQLDSNITILCSKNASANMWNSIAQGPNTSEEHVLRSRDTFLEVDDPHGHIKKMLQTSVLNTMMKNGIPNHELKIKIGDVCLVLRAIHGLGLANNLRVRIVEIGAHSVEVVTMGEIEEQKLRLPRISFKFRLPYGKSYQILRIQYPLRLASYAMTLKKVNLRHLQRCFLTLPIPPLLTDNCTLQ